MRGNIGVAKIVFVGVCLVLGFACIPSLDDLERFPCANDGSCPRGLSCTPGVGCVRAAIDSPCIVGQTNCASAGQGATCALGLCTVACDERRPCGSGHTCSSPPSAGEGVCTPTCGEDGSCPPGLTCRPLGYENARGCLGPISKSPLGGPCETTASCDGSGTAVECILGVCTVPCSPEKPCEKGQLCSALREGGGCLPDCTNGERCAQGLECRPIGYSGKKACVGASAPAPCSSDLATDPKHCGTCTTACKASESCEGGTCKCTKLTCGAACVDGTTDARNCGACGKDCGTGTCVAGKCTVGELGTLGSTELLIGADSTYAYVDNSTASRWGVRRISLRDKTSSQLVNHAVTIGTYIDVPQVSTTFDNNRFFAALFNPQNEIMLSAPSATGVAKVLRTQPYPMENWNSMGELRGGVHGNRVFVESARVSPCQATSSLLGWIDATTGSYPNARIDTEYDCPIDLEGQSHAGNVPSVESADLYYFITGTKLRRARLTVLNPVCPCCAPGWQYTQSEVLRTGLTCKTEKGGEHPTIPIIAEVVGPAVAEMKLDGQTLLMIGNAGKLEAMNVTTLAVTTLANVDKAMAMIVTPTHVVWLERALGTNAAIYRVPRTGGTPEKLADTTISTIRFSATHSSGSFVWRDGANLRMFTP
jgi:hypothetical protein